MSYKSLHMKSGRIPLVAFDPALNNWGIAMMEYDLQDGCLHGKSLELVKTESEAGKVVRKNSDDLRRASVLQNAMARACEFSVFAVAEVPTGAQSARAMFSNGICLGVLASCQIPLIQVTPSEVKIAAVGDKNATKKQIIDWAVAKYPTLPWLTRKHNGEVKLTDANEHLADAVAIAHAGTKTEQFKQAIAMMKAAA